MSEEKKPRAEEEKVAGGGLGEHGSSEAGTAFEVSGAAEETESTPEMGENPSRSEASEPDVSDEEAEGKSAASTNSNDGVAGKPKKHLGKVGKIAVGAVAAVLILAIVGAMLPCNHEWRDATCTEPKTCKKCNETEGGPLGHDYADATCTEPKTCKRCGQKVDSPLGHQVSEWTTEKEATCAETGLQSGVCTRCGEKQTKSIPKLDHTPGEWEITKASTVSSNGQITPGEKQLSCTVCGAVIETQPYKIEATTSQLNALRTAQSYLSTMPFSHKGLVKQLEYEGYSTDDATFAADNCGADWNVQAAKSAQSYLSFMGFSHSGLVDQLEYEGYTHDQAEYGVSAAGL